MANKIDFLKPPEPSFLKKIKEKIGYKEGPSVSEKFQKGEGPLADDNDVERDDERPVVVQLKKGDMDEEEAMRYEEFTGRKRQLEDSSSSRAKTNKQDRREEGPEPNDGKLVFRKPPKGSGKEKKEASRGGQKRKTRKSSKMQEVNDSRLLSFDDSDDVTE
ncbi:uncharacterized protein KIAA1143 homolog [Oscarella lobularis]|uniref:uncharacterized protein KIAA1143 homolog n=1 Tax=Oscarella lobularis TaxID=121494 RepID=UPI00331410F7